MEMTNELNELYGKTANHISNMIPVDWEELYCMGVVTQDGASSAVFYFREEGQQEFIRSYDIAKTYDESEEMHNELKGELRAIVVEINECFEDHDQKLWDILTFKLNSEGAFNIDFEYDSTNNDRGPLERELIWAYENFGYIPPSNYFKKLLDKHIQAGNLKPKGD
ncbi:MAG: antitoxin YezG family protein [Defluviitaleaceae bacterium]|nr:antitoxin YezG family protein [Defluviitaleaceae bacterium]